MEATPTPIEKKWRHDSERNSPAPSPTTPRETMISPDEVRKTLETYTSDEENSATREEDTVTEELLGVSDASLYEEPIEQEPKHQEKPVDALQEEIDLGALRLTQKILSPRLYTTPQDSPAYTQLLNESLDRLRDEKERVFAEQSEKGTVRVETKRVFENAEHFLNGRMFIAEKSLQETLPFLRMLHALDEKRKKEHTHSTNDPVREILESALLAKDPQKALREAAQISDTLKEQEPRGDMRDAIEAALLAKNPQEALKESVTVGDINATEAELLKTAFARKGIIQGKELPVREQYRVTPKGTTEPATYLETRDQLYASFKNDPVVRKYEKQITANANALFDAAPKKEDATLEDAKHLWERFLAEASTAAWDEFVRVHPDKATLYAKDNPNIQKAIERSRLKDEKPIIETPSPEKSSAITKKLEVDSSSVILPSQESPQPTTHIEHPPESHQEKSEEHTPTETEKAFGEFHIAPEELATIEGFSSLSDGKKLFVLRSLQQLTIGRVEEEARTLYKQQTTEARFLGKVWRSFKIGCIGEQAEQAMLQQKTYQTIAEGGMPVHRKTIRALTAIAGNNPEVSIAEDGSYTIAYTDTHELAGESPPTQEEERAVIAFNDAAKLFATTPEEWGTARASRKEAVLYKTAYDEYSRARSALLLAAEHRFHDPKKSALYVADKDTRVHMHQFLNTHPDVEKELHSIPFRNTWDIASNGFKKALTEKGVFAGIGTMGRFATPLLLGGIASYVAPFAAAGMIGAVRGGWKARERFDAAVKEGTHSESRQEKHILKESPLKYTDFTDASNITERLHALLAKTTSPSSNTELTRQHLSRLIAFTHEKERLQFLNYGTGDAMLTQKYELASAIAEAEAFLMINGNPGTSSKEHHLTKALGLHKKRISHEQKRYIVRQALRGATVAVAFAGIGRALANMFPTTPSPSHTKAVLPEKTSSPSTSPTHVPLTERITRQRTEEAIIHTKNTQLGERMTNLEQHTSLSAPPTPEHAPSFQAPATSEVYRETAHAGDSVWSMLERQLRSSHAFGEKFDALPESERVYLIDAFKDEVVAHPEAFGLKNPDKIRVGQTIDFTELFSAKPRLSHLLDTAEKRLGLSLEHIEQAEKTLAEWHTTHTDTPLSEAKIDDILSLSSPRGNTAGNIQIIGKEDIATPPGKEPEEFTSIFLRETENAMRRQWGLDAREYADIRNMNLKTFLSQYQKGASLPDTLPPITGRKFLRLSEFIRNHQRTTWNYVPELTVRQFFEYLMRTKERP